ncbi:MAG: RagB/SusD family nutrient uptake outer membrane protein [Bacteroidia bacterium]|nr:RagB/SusD family nutrient uptake outer membrane protein [Bacteroidia bacterium]
MKKIIYILFAGMLFTSCLDKLPEDAIPADKAITTISEANQAVIGLYSSFLSSSLYSGALSIMPDLQCDMVYAVNGYTNTYGDTWRWEILSTNANIEAVYGSLYNVITSANFLLDYEDRLRRTITDDDDLDRLDQYCGEAHMARAIAYWELIRLFTKPYDEATADTELGVVITEHYNQGGEIYRSTLKESVDFLMKEIALAEEMLKLDDDYKPSTHGPLYSSNYFNEYVAHALHARVALYLGRWEEAAKEASKLIDCGYYLLSSASSIYSGQMSYFDYLWQYDEGTETIWKVGFTSTAYGGALGRIFFNYDYQSVKPDYVPAQWVINLYEANDLRVDTYFSVFTTGHTHGLQWPLLVKYWGNPNFSSQGILHMHQPKVFRLAEQYLIRAEANAMLGKYTEAAKDIATLRKARYTSYTSTPHLDAKTALQVIEQERVKELYMEGFRLTDLKRWHKGFERTPQSESVKSGSSLKVEADDALFVWPIPQHELEAPGANILPNESNR